MFAYYRHVVKAARPLRVAIVGYGQMGQIRRDVLRSSPDFELVAIAEVATRVFDAEDVTVCRSPTEVYILEPDAVFVCTPPNRIVIEALEHGCHVFAEKPPGRTVTDAQRILDAASRRADLKVVFGFNHRYRPAVRAAKTIADQGSHGRILWLRGLYGRTPNGLQNSWRNVPAVSGGGILLDQGIHLLDLFRFFCGDFHEVAGLTGRSQSHLLVEDDAVVILRSRLGPVAQLHSSASLIRNMFRLEVGLEHAQLDINGMSGKSDLYGHETLTINRHEPNRDVAETLRYPDVLPWEAETRAFASAILDDDAIISAGPEDALAAMSTIDSIYRQIRETVPTAT